MSDTRFSGKAVLEASYHLEDYNYEPRPLGPDDIELDIICCGICGSDLHQGSEGWLSSAFPMIPGHEIVGNVVQKGENVDRFEIGDRVGVGAQVFSCHTDDCIYCANHNHHLCRKRVFTYNDKYVDGHASQGGYATGVRVQNHFAFKIPDNLSSAEVAPLLCAGITTFRPLDFHNVRNLKVGVAGIGGLGHLGIKFAVALGNEVKGISRSKAKEEDVISWGGVGIVSSSDKQEMKAHRNYFDVILNTIDGADLNWQPYFELLKPFGKFLNVGLPDGKIHKLPTDVIVANELTYTGSLIGPPGQIEEMLQLASEHEITADVTEYPLANVNQAWQDFRDGKPRYRFVLRVRDE
eukprot:TRINITY_DN8259_c0_g2_i1.p1 TRINITY_DN8259_c0_g2~~TRINITY_DN8259_c0_g2_i1.p1  ORF type:complete len:367 (+),score=81.23 TRINITY_DN8259_c0_g2_i1:49-1101(+)